MRIEARGDVASTGWRGAVYARADGLDAGLLMDYARTFGLAETSGTVGLRLWGTWRDGRMAEAAGRLRVRSLRVVPVGKTPWEVRRGRAWFGVTRGGTGDTSLALDRLVLATPSGTWPETRLRLTLGSRTGDAPASWLAACAYLRVEDVLPLVSHRAPVEHRAL